MPTLGITCVLYKEACKNNHYITHTRLITKNISSIKNQHLLHARIYNMVVCI